MSTTRNVLAIAVLFGAAAARAQGIIESVAGGGPGNGSPALAVNLRTPQEVVRDSSGNLYIAVSDDRRVYRIGTDGNISLIAGSGGSGTDGDGGPATAAELVSPKGLAIDFDGSLLIADEGARRVRRVDLGTGSISTLVGGGSLTGEGVQALQLALDAPRDLAVQGSSALYVADGHRVRKLVRASGLVSTVAGTGVAGFSDGANATTRQLNEPRALAFDPTGKLLIADGGNGRIRRLDLAANSISTVVSGVCSPGGVAVDAAGTVYFTSNTGSCGSSSQKYMKWVSGSPTTLAASGSSFVAQLSVLPDGSLVAADRDSFRIRSISVGGSVTNLAGNGTIGSYGDGVPALSASYLSPTHVRADAVGNLYVVDNTNRIRRVTPAEIDVTLASTANCGSDPKSYLCSVEGLAILPGGDLAFSESKNDMLHRINPATGVVTDLTTSALGRVRGIASSAAGFVYVADRGPGASNGSIKKVNATTGAVSDVATGLARPQYVAVDGSANVYFVSVNASSIQKISAGDGSASTWITLTSAVTGLDADDAGNLYVADSNNQVWLVAAGTAVKSLFAGSGVAGFSGDGGPAVAARLSGPSGVSYVTGGDVYIADTLNYRIRRVRQNHNLGPLASAGPDQTVEATSPSGASVTLDGSGSSDPDGDPLTYSWSGPFGSASGASPSVNLPLGTHTITLTVSDGSATASDTVVVILQDTTGPQVTYVRSPLPNAHGWNNTNVTLSFSCADSASGVPEAASAPVVVSAEGAGQSRSHTCTDVAGNSASVTVSDINIDKTAPTPTATRFPAANANGWNRTDVTVTFTAVDNLSGIDACDAAKVLSDEAANQSASGSCSDKAGNGASATASGISIDKTAPSLSFAAASPGANSNGWNNSDVTFAFTTSDGLSGVDTTSIPSPLVLTGEGSALSGTVDVTDRAGNSASFPSPTVKIDRTGPVVSGSRSPLANVYGWNNTDVTATFSATDALSGLGSCEDPVVVSAEGASQTVTRSCTDQAGNSASATVSDISIDKTAPTPTATRLPAANANGWNRTDVTVTFTAVDDLSGVDACDVPKLLSNEAADQSASGSCSDKAGNSASATASDISIDKTNPSLSFAAASPGANSNGWNNGDVTFAFTTSDGLSGVDTTSIPSPLVLTGEGSALSGTVDVTDRAGNSASFPSPTVKIDRTGPVVSGSRSPLANVYGWNNSDVTATFSATDALSGLGSCEDPVVVSAEGASQTVTRSCTDQAGNSASATVSDISIDKTAPTPTATRLPAANANGWNRTDVTVSFSAVDDLAGVDACDPAKVLSNEAADQSASGSCSDKAGNTASATASGISIDKTNPSLSFAPASPSANANGWNNSSVTFAFTTSDALSGVDTTSIPSPLVLTGEGNAVSGTVDVTDRAGNSASFPSPTVKIDKTAPVVSGSRSPLANIYGWNNSDVTASFSATDALSGLGSCDAPVVVTGEGASQTVTRSCTDQAGNSASATVSDINIDKTAPSVTGAPARPADHNGWYNHAISVTWSANDPLSGVASCSSASSYSGPDALVATVTGHCSDKAGNEGTGTQTLKYDATAPTVSITTPPSGATYTLDQSVTAHYSCADNLSGVSSCSGPVADGAAVSTSPVGSKSFKVDAMDTAGNTASLTNNYSIKYQFVGFLQPVDNLPVVNVATAGRTIPIKWQLKKASGGYVTELSSFVSLLWAPLACDASPTDIVEEETTATGGTTLRYDPVANQFIYNWDTQKSWARTCVQIQLTLADGTRQFAKMSFK